MSTVIEEPLTRAELEEAISNHNETLHRMPEHWLEKRAAIHAKIDALLTDWIEAAH